MKQKRFFRWVHPSDRIEIGLTIRINGCFLVNLYLPKKYIGFGINYK